MHLLVRQRNFGLLFVSGLVSGLGDWFLIIALPFYVYGLTGSAVASGGTFIAESLPSLIFGSFAGVFVDRWDRRMTMIVADSLRAVLLLGLLAVHSRETVWIIYVVSFVQATIGRFFNPAKGAFVPAIVAKEDLLVANSLLSVSNQFTMLVGPTLGGIALALFGLSTAIVVDSASFLISAITIGFVAVARPTGKELIPLEGRASSAWANVWRDYRSGLALIRHNSIVIALLLAMGICSFGQGIINVQLIPWVKDVLHGDSLIFGWVVTAQAIGGLIGGLALGSVGKAFSPTKVIATGLVVSGLLLIAASNTTVLPVVLFLFALIGIAVVVLFVRLQTLLQVSVTDDYRGRVLAAYGTTQSGLLLIGMALSGALSGAIGTVPALDIAGMLYVAGGLAVASVLPRAFAARSSTVSTA
jgi:MFS family permease